jgi:hypothetical protein
MSTSMRKTSVLIGKPRTSFQLMPMVASMSIDASSPMAGKSKSITLSTTRCMPADSRMYVKSHTVHISTQIETEDNQLTNSLKYFQRIEALLCNRLSSIKASSLICFSMFLAESARFMSMLKAINNNIMCLSPSTDVAPRVCLL